MVADFPVCDNQVQIEFVRSEGKKHRDFERFITPLIIIEDRIKIQIHDSEKRAKVLTALKFIQFEIAKLLNIEEMAHKRISPTTYLGDGFKIHITFDKENL